MASRIPCDTRENKKNFFQKRTGRIHSAVFLLLLFFSSPLFGFLPQNSLSAYVPLTKNLHVAGVSAEEWENEETPANKIIISADAKSHASYRGRDGGVSQAAVNSSIALALKSGFRFSLAVGWTEEPEFHRDGTSFGAGYDFSLTPTMGASVSYTFLSYTDSSTQNQSVFHHSLDGGVYWETAIVQLAADIGISIGSSAEYALTVHASHEFPFGKFSFAPSLAVSWGEQNGALAAERLVKAEKATGKSNGKGKGKGTAGGQETISGIYTTPKNVFSIMAYEFTFPLTICLGSWTITPSFTAVIPLNVIDGSREVPFGNAGLTFVYEFKL